MRQHAIAALNIVQQAKKVLDDSSSTAGSGTGGDESRNTGLIEGVRKFAMDMRELDIDLIDRPHQSVQRSLRDSREIHE